MRCGVAQRAAMRALQALGSTAARPLRPAKLCNLGDFRERIDQGGSTYGRAGVLRLACVTRYTALVATRHRIPSVLPPWYILSRKSPYALLLVFKERTFRTFDEEPSVLR